MSINGTNTPNPTPGAPAHATLMASVANPQSTFPWPQPHNGTHKAQGDAASVPGFDTFDPPGPRDPADYAPYIGTARVDELRRLADPLVGTRWTHINSTLVGGGVAEMLRSVVPLARGLGLEAQWYAMRGSEPFFQVTKKFHNMLQGLTQPLALTELFEAYLDTIEATARHTHLTADLMVVHDPQPAALVLSGALVGNVLWRCHIDTSTPNPTVWRFLMPYINHCAGAIFTLPDFVGPGLGIPLYQLTPCIDPLADKNCPLSDGAALETLAPLFQAHDVDPARPILAAISRYDVHKNQDTILRAFQRLRQERTYAVPPYLIFLGNTATDDPEGGAVLDSLRQQAGDDPDVRFWVNVDNNDAVVGALMHIARGFVHVSTREGFGLVVAEALWHGTPVIGARVGGIAQQIQDGHSGYLVAPQDAEAIAAHMARLLDAPEAAAIMGQAGQAYVRQHFLLPELLRRYLLLLRYYTRIQQEIPAFRLNDLTYSEVLQMVRPQHPGLPVTAWTEGGRPDMSQALACAPVRRNGSSMSLRTG